MRKFILTLGLFLAVSQVKAAVSPPLDRQGHALYTIDWVGANSVQITNTVGTSPVFLGSGPVIIYGVIASSVSPVDFLVFRDTNAANIFSATATLVYANGTSANSTTASTLTIKFPVPIRLNRGGSVNASGTPLAGSAGWTVLYRSSNATE